MQAGYNFIEKETLAQVFSCEFCEISKNTFFHETPLMAVSLFVTVSFEDTASRAFNVFFKCAHVKSFWEQLNMVSQNDFVLPPLTPQATVLEPL